jgi:hypothetical protein
MKYSTPWPTCSGKRAGRSTERLDSLSLTAYAEGILMLHRYGRVVIEEQRGRWVIARFVESIH